MSTLETLRQPEYTGENRCLPCSIVNVAIAIGASALVAVTFVRLGTITRGITVAGFVLAASLCAIWLRGYLVPGTPTLTKRYMPPRLLARFGKGAPTVETDETIDLEATLVDAGVLEPCPGGNDLCTADAFHRDWAAEIASASDNPDPITLLERLGIETDDVTTERYDDAVVAVEHEGGTKIGQWPSASAIILDIAAAPLIAERVPEWDDLSPTTRSQIVAGVRIFRDECPGHGAVEFSSETVESCCSSYEVVTAVCGETGDRLLEQPIR